MSYISFEKQLRLDADKYCERATKYLNEGKIDKAIGCLNKAMVKIKRADMLKMSPLEEAIFGPIMNELSKLVAKRIIEEGKL